MGALGRGESRGGERGAAQRQAERDLALETRHSFLAEADAGVRLDLLVATRLGLSRTGAATLIANGNVTVAGRREKASYRALPDDRIDVVIPPPESRAILPEKIALSVVHEDESVLVVDKPAGMVVHPAPGNWTGTLVNALLGRDGRAADGTVDRAGIVHRLDKETSGLLVVAKTERAQRLLGAAIAERRVARRYAAMVWGHLDADRLTIDRPIARDPNDRKRMAVVSSGREARTDFVRLARYNAGDLLRAQLHTGRTHQIRVHLASVGKPVMGDDVYGGGGGRRLAQLQPKRHFLHAAWLRFHHPDSGELLDLRAPLPRDLRQSLAAIAEDPAVTASADPLVDLGFYEEKS